MFDLAQIILGFVIVTLTVLLVIVGIQVFFILHEFRQTIKKANKVLDNVRGGLPNNYSKLASEKVEKVKKMVKTVQSQLTTPKRRFFKGKKPL